MARDDWQDTTEENDEFDEQYNEFDNEFDEQHEYPDDELADAAGETKDIYKLLEWLYSLFQGAKTVPFSKKRLVNAEIGLRIVNDLRGNLPVSIQQSNEVINRRESIISEAKRLAEAKTQAASARSDSILDNASKQGQKMQDDAQDRADRILTEAQSRARAMIDNTEIMRQASEEAMEIKTDARADASDQKLKAKQYVETLLTNLEEDMRKTLEYVRRTRKSFEDGE